MFETLRAGVAVYNAGDFHAAHDAWEERWLDLESGSDDERFLHGLIQFTAAGYHARRRNWEGATGLAESGRDYLAPLPETYRGVDVATVRRFLAALASDPETIERRGPPRLAVDGEVVTLEDLTPAEVVVAAIVYAEEEGYDEEPIERAGEYALSALEDGADDPPFLETLYAFVLEPEDRGIIHRRIAQQVQRRVAREEDLEGLFE